MLSISAPAPEMLCRQGRALAARTVGSQAGLKGLKGERVSDPVSDELRKRLLQREEEVLVAVGRLLDHSTLESLDDEVEPSLSFAVFSCVLFVPESLRWLP